MDSRVRGQFSAGCCAYDCTTFLDIEGAAIARRTQRVNLLLVVLYFIGANAISDVAIEKLSRVVEAPWLFHVRLLVGGRASHVLSILRAPAHLGTYPRDSRALKGSTFAACR